MAYTFMLQALRHLTASGDGLGRPASRFLRDAGDREPSPAALGAVLQRLALLAEKPDLGLRFGQQITEPNLSIVGSVVLASRTLGDAYANYVWLAGLIRLEPPGRLEVIGNRTRYVMPASALGQVWDDMRVSLSFHTVLRFLATTLRAETRLRAAVHAHFARRKPESMGNYDACFQGRVAFEQGWTGLSFPTEVMHLARPGADPSLAAELRQIVRMRFGPKDTTDRTSWTKRVAGALRERAELAQADFRAVALHLGLSQRTLRRRLTDEGTTFSDVLDTTRFERARHYLLQSSSTTVAEVAELLGYTDEATFRRAFKRWTGQAPQEYRALHGAPTVQTESLSSSA